MGCALGCRFASPPAEGLTRNLTAAEMVNQVLAVNPYVSAAKPLTNLVFMGMGEALTTRLPWFGPFA